eukprot:scaffold1339_cov129-Skeletonema_dohrnii-CCMP3373.AAC.1
MWMARRSKTKSKFPSMLDHIVAGGQPAGLSHSSPDSKSRYAGLAHAYDLLFGGSQLLVAA